MLAGAFGRLLQRNDLSGVGPALDAVLAQPLPSDVTIDHPLDGPQPLDEFLETMRRRVDEGNFGQPPAAAVRGEVLVMYDAGLLPGLPPMVADGVHTVNDDMPPGQYVIWDVAECSWERRDSDGDVLANNFIRLAGRSRGRHPRRTTTSSAPRTAAAGSSSTDPRARLCTTATTVPWGTWPRCYSSDLTASSSSA